MKILPPPLQPQPVPMCVGSDPQLFHNKNKLCSMTCGGAFLWNTNGMATVVFQLQFLLPPHHSHRPPLRRMGCDSIFPQFKAAKKFIPWLTSTTTTAKWNCTITWNIGYCRRIKRGKKILKQGPAILFFSPLAEEHASWGCRLSPTGSGRPCAPTADQTRRHSAKNKFRKRETFFL